MKSKKHQSSFVKLMSLLLSIAVLCAAVPFAVYGESSEDTVTKQENRTVRIAFPSQSGMSGVGSSGDLEGYNYEYLQKLAEYAGWNLEFITFEDMSANDGIMSAMQMVMSGEADLLGPMLKSDAVEEMFDFPKANYGVVYTTLCAPEKSNITSVNYSSISPLRVALYASAATRNKEVTDYLDQQGVNYELIMCDSSDEQIKMLNEGKADVLSSITLSYFDGTRSVAEFAPRPYYFVTTKGNEQLLKELDEATASLNYTLPYLQQQLQETYFGDTSSGYVLTDAELSCINNMHSLKVLCASPQDAPYVLKNDKGEAAGMMVSVIDDFAAQNRMTVSYKFCSSPAEADEEWGTGKYDCMIGMPFSSQYCTDHSIIRTEAITSVDLVLFGKPQTSKLPKESTVAIYNRLADQINLEKYGNVLEFDNPSECFEAVESGEADYGCTDRLIAEYTLFERNSELVTIPLLGEKEEISIGISRHMSDEFVSALNKFIHTMSDNTKTTYLSEGSHHNTETSLRSLMRSHPIGVAVTLSIILILIMSCILFAFYASRSKKKNEELKRANSAKSEFLARMSHDIRTPMNAITGYLGIAKDTEGCPERVKHCLDNSEVAAKHLLQLINDVLDMSSIESGKMKIAGEDFSLKNVISDVTTIFYQSSREKGIHFETQILGLTEEWVTGDQLRVNQILMNLLSNSVKFTPEGGSVRLAVQQTGADENGIDLAIMVSDTGIGMSEEYMSRLFQPFEQEEASTARKYGGSGLGLSIVHSLAEMMGGSIEVESRQNEGSKFTVTLHFDKAVNHSNTLFKIPEKDSMYVLLVSENEDKAENMKTIFETLGVKADIVTKGSYAVKRAYRRIASDYPYAMCMVDWKGTDTDPVQIVTDIREKLGTENKIAMIAAGYDITEFEDEAVNAGVDKYVNLPLFTSAAADIIRALASGKDLSEAQEKKGVSIDLTGKRVLLAEDNAMNMEIAVSVLGKTGVTADQAENGQRAVELFEKSAPGTYDFILMDVQMPVMDGYEATKAIRSSEHSDAGRIPIIAMTANAFAEDVNTAMKNGMSAHISKPVNYDKLFSVLSDFMEEEKKA